MHLKIYEPSTQHSVITHYNALWKIPSRLFLIIKCAKSWVQKFVIITWSKQKKSIDFPGYPFQHETPSLFTPLKIKTQYMKLKLLWTIFSSSSLTTLKIVFLSAYLSHSLSLSLARQYWGHKRNIKAWSLESKWGHF